MRSYRPLPQIMVAPNGARLKTDTHPAVPVTIAQTVATAKACQDAGADGLHAHVRDADQNHILDAGMYRELLAELKTAVSPDFYVQVTSEAVGLYRPQEQRDVIYNCAPSAVSFSVKEMLRGGTTPEVSSFYHAMADQGTMVQHILYSPEDVTLLTDLVTQGIVPQGEISVLFVLGRYTAGMTSTPEDLHPFLPTLDALSEATGAAIDWACCAFGPQETACLKAAIAHGGKARIGFENNTINANGDIAVDNADRVRDLTSALVM